MDLTAPVYAGPRHRIPGPNSTPRTIGLIAAGPAGQVLLRRAIAGGARAVPLEPAVILAAESRPRIAPDLNALVIVGAPEEATAPLAEIYQWAGRIGMLVTGVVTTPQDADVTQGDCLKRLRKHCDLLCQTPDEDFLPTMLEWLGQADANDV